MLLLQVKDMECHKEARIMASKAQCFAEATQTYTLKVIEVQPEEGGGGTVRATLLSNCATVLLKVRACLGRRRVVVLMWVRDRWTGTQRHWQTRMCHWSWWGCRTRRCGHVRVQVALEDDQAVVNGFRASLEHEHVAGSQAEEQA